VLVGVNDDHLLVLLDEVLLVFGAVSDGQTVLVVSFEGESSEVQRLVVIWDDCVQQTDLRLGERVSHAVYLYLLRLFDLGEVPLLVGVGLAGLGYLLLDLLATALLLILPILVFILPLPLLPLVALLHLLHLEPLLVVGVLLVLIVVPAVLDVV
jgi:hypothetical protein